MRIISSSTMKRIFTLGIIFFADLAYASQNIGVIANQLTSPVDFLTTIIYKICYLIGFVLVVSSFFQYRRYRNNPTEVRLSQPVMLLILGICIGLLPLIPQFLSSRLGTELFR